MIQDKIYCLHHPPLVERKKKIQAAFAHQNITPEWVEFFAPEPITLLRGAIDGRKGSVSLYLKHLYCLFDQIKNKHERILVFEDDCIIPDNFPFTSFYNKCIHEFTELNGDMMFIGMCCKLIVSNPDPNKFVYHTPHYGTRCTHCYVVTLSCAERIVDKMLNCDTTIDFKYDEIIRDLKLKSCHTYPHLIQGSEFGIT